MDLSALPDPVIHPNALKVLNKQNYCWPRPDGTRETPREMFERVAKFVASAESIWGGDQEAETVKLYNALAAGEFIFNTPAMVNAGKDNGMLSACFVLPLEDSTDDIYSTVKASALVQTAGGGTGFDGSHLRGRGSLVGSTGKVSGGAMSTLRLLNASSREFITQGSARKGANMFQLNCLHADIEEFIDIKIKDGELSEFNISAAATDSFMYAVRAGTSWDLYDPKGIPLEAWKTKTFEQLTSQMRRTKTLLAQDLWKKIVYNAWKFGGDPGLYFVDTTNNVNPTPHVGQFSATNPCVTGETLIQTDRGLERMADFVADARPDALVLGGEGQWRKVLRYLNNGIKKVYKITTRSGYSIRATEYHKFPVVGRNDLVKLSDLTVGMKLHLQSSMGRFVSTDDLGVEKAELLGWMIGDGYLSKMDSSKMAGLIVGKYDRNLIPKFQEWIEQAVGAPATAYERPEYSTTQLLTKRLWKWMVQDLGITPKKAGEKVVPEVIFKSSAPSIKAFLRGLFSADGKVQLSKYHGGKGKSDTIILTSKSRQLLSDVQILFAAFGHRTSLLNRSRPPKDNVFSHTKPDGSVVKYGSSGVCWELFLHGNARQFFLDEVGFTDGCYKTEKLNKLPRNVTDPYRGFGPMDEIVAIVEDGEEPVYDITVDDPNGDLTMCNNGLISFDCGEQPLLPYEACVLGHINLAKFYQRSEQDLYRAFYNAVRWLDNVIEINYYPLSEIEAMHKNGNRKIGVGHLGFANLLAKRKIPYGSEQARKLARHIGEIWQEATDQASVDLAQERGSFNNFVGSALETKFPNGIRNACRRTIAPTGSTSIIMPPAPESTGVEPIFGLVQSRNQAGMKMYDVNYVFDQALENEGLTAAQRQLVLDYVSERGTLRGCDIVPEWMYEVYQQANDISPEDHVLMQAIWQLHNDSATSKTINLAKNATLEDVEKAYWLAWETKCKGITVYVDGSRKGQPLTVGNVVETKPIDPKHEIVSKFKQLNGHTLDVAKEIVALLTPEQIAQLGLQQVTIDVPASKLGRDRSHVTQGTGRKMETGCGNAFIFLGQNADGGLDDVVGRLGKSGGCASAFWEGLSRVTSIALRHGVSIDEIRKQLTGISCHRPAFHHTPGQEKPDTITSCADGLATALYEFQLEQTKANQTMPPAALIEAKAVGGDIAQPTPVAQYVQQYAKEQHVGACSSCGSHQLDYGGGCMVCRDCGMSSC